MSHRIGHNYYAWADPADPKGNTARAVEMWKEGHSCSQIARAIGCESRSAVIGKLYRLGVAKRSESPTGEKRKTFHRKPKVNGWQAAVAKKAKAQAKVAKPKKATDDLWGEADTTPVTRHGEAIEVPVARRKQLADLEPGQCRYPYGDIEKDRESFYFCGDKVHPGLSYCEAHARCCYRAPDTPRRAVDKHRTGFSLPPNQPRARREEGDGAPAPLDFEREDA